MPDVDPRPRTDNTVERVRLHVYRHLATTGEGMGALAVADQLGLSPLDAAHAFDALHASRHLVLDADRHILMAHPFSTVPLGFSVMGARTLWWGGCAWDSFAIPHLVPSDPWVLVATTCPGCGTAHSWMVGREGPPAGEQIAHFLTPVEHIWDDVLHSCANQRIFCSEEHVDLWLERTGQPRGYSMSLTTLWMLARGWYAGRLDTPYVRREPAQAAAYFASVGLRGPFWGLPRVSWLSPATRDAMRALKKATGPLDRLAGIQNLRTALDDEPATLAAVRQAQDAGAGWDSIAAASGLSVAAAKWRWQGTDAEIAQRHEAGRKRSERPSSKPTDLPGLSVAEAAAQLGISVQGVYQRVSRGLLRAETVTLSDGRSYKRVFPDPAHDQ